MKKMYGLNEKYKRAIVTGGAGFVGSHLVDSLLAEGLEVISIDDYIAGIPENLEHLKGNDKFTEVNCDVTDYENFKKWFDGVDIVFHQAASKKTVCLKDPRRDLEVNGAGAFNVVELARDFGVKKVVHASTGSVYGEPSVFPQTETHPLCPNSYYGVSKLAGERYAKAFNTLYDLDVTILRYYHVYGTRQTYSDFGGVIPIFCRRLLKNESPIIHGDGTQVRSFTYVDDIVNINKLVAMRDDTKGEVFNCPSAIQITISEMCDMIKEILSKKDIPTEYDDWTVGDIKQFILDNSKIKSIGYDKFVDFEEGLAETVAWMKTVIKG